MKGIVLEAGTVLRGFAIVFRGRTGALVETRITWRPDSASRRADRDEGTFSTIGVDSDQLAAAIIATEKMLNAMVPKQPIGKRSGRSSRRDG